MAAPSVVTPISIIQLRKIHSIRTPLIPNDIDDNFDRFAKKVNEIIAALAILAKDTRDVADASLTFTAFTQDLGVADRCGTFTLTGLTGLETGEPVLVVQTQAAIASKGNSTDESEMDLIVCTGIVLSSSSIRVNWATVSGDPAVGTYAFAYAVAR